MRKLPVLLCLAAFCQMSVANDKTTDGNAFVATTVCVDQRSAEAINASCIAALGKYVELRQLAGAVSMVSVSGKVSVASVGVADPATGRAFDEKSLFWIASMSKGFCGAAVMACVDRGLLCLDDEVERYVPSVAKIRVRDKADDGSEIPRAPKVKMTIRMCLSHVAGFPFVWSACPGLPERIADIVLTCDPLQKHQYSNVDIEVAARCVEVVSGMDYDEFLKRTFFVPLGMTETTFRPTPEQADCLVATTEIRKDGPFTLANGRSWAHYATRESALRKGIVPQAGAGLFSTAGDVMRFYAMLANDGCTADGTRILSHAAIVELSRSQYPALDRYTLGFRQYGDWFGHDGALQTEAYANPKRNEVRLMYVQVIGPWDHPFKIAWRKASGIAQ